MSSTSSSQPRILSGVQPSGKLHIGNYFGAIKQHIELQDKGDAFYFIADFHALTTLRQAEATEAGLAAKDKSVRARPACEILRDNVRDVALDYLALGLDPTKATFYRQSDVPEVTELAWILSTVTGTGLLERAHSYKDKVEKGLDASVGLFTYPVLMAADILIVRSHLVPVGRDQVQHLEMTRDMAGYFNQAYGEVFPEPQAVTNEAAIVPGTDGQKMSKSYSNTIDIFAEGKALKNAVMGIKTDSTPVEARRTPTRATPSALYQLFASAEEQTKLADLYRNPMKDADARGGRPFGYGDAKTLLLGKVDAYFAPARERRKQLERNPGIVEEALASGARRAREVVQVTMRLVRESVGINQRPV